MIPSREEAANELKVAGELNPGVWIDHSYNVAEAAQIIAEKSGLDAEKAYIFGLMHDIGRRTGISKIRHIIDGYDYVIEKGWDEIARICLTHSFPIKYFDAIMGPRDVTEEQIKFMTNYLDSIEYDDYDKLIILCDAIADAKGFCILEKRFVDTTIRYGICDYTIDRWKKTMEYKEYFESKIGQSIYELLPGIERCIYN